MDRFTWGFVGGALALCVLTIASIFLVRRQSPPSLSAPAGAVTAYVQAVRDRDADRAWDLLAPGAIVGPAPPFSPASEAPRDAFRRQMATLDQGGGGTRRIRIVGATEKDGTARVTIEITTTTAGPPLLTGDDSRTVTFTLKQLDGAWKIDSGPSLYEIG
jgi:ketosteroid isomerase-like protein